VLDKADVVLEVVDARDPMGCRCYDIERRIQAMNANGESKKLVIVMNKIDLIPPDVATQWVTHFRREFPTIAFKSSTQQQSSKLSQNNVKLANMEDSGVLQQKGAVGSGALMSLLKNYARTLNLKKAITVGIIGFPNVGKSSIINSLKRSKAAGVSASAGHTKVLQTIKIDHNISLIDSPGVLFGAGESQADLVLRNCVKVEQMEDPLDAVVKLLAKVPKESLLDIYRVADFSSPQQFVSHVAHKRGKLKAGGVPNLHAAAVTILKDWTSGAIPFYTLPPAVTIDPRYERKDIVSGFGKELDIEQLLDDHTEELRTLDAPVDVNRNYIVTEASAPLNRGMDDPGMEESENEDNDDDEDDDEEDDEEEEDDEGAEEEMGEEAGERMNDEEAEDEVEEEEEEPAVEVAPVTSIDMSKVKKSTKGKGEKKGSVKKAVTRSAAAVAPGLQRNKEIKKSQKKATKKKNKKMAD
jgi:nuclear GTP-binding protein